MVLELPLQLALLWQRRPRACHGDSRVLGALEGCRGLEETFPGGPLVGACGAQRRPGPCTVCPSGLPSSPVVTAPVYGQLSAEEGRGARAVLDPHHTHRLSAEENHGVSHGDKQGCSYGGGRQEGAGWGCRAACLADWHELGICTHGRQHAACHGCWIWASWS